LKQIIYFHYKDNKMSDYHFYQKGKQIVALKHSEENQALKLINQGYEKQF